MRSGLWNRFETAVRGLTPFVLTLTLAMAAVIPLRLPDFAPVTPSLTVIAVYYWSINRPDLMPMAAVFAIGVFQDALAGMPLGVSALVLITVQYVVIAQRRFFHGKSFLVEWWGFMLVAPGAAFVSWLLVSIYFATLVSPRPLGFQLLLSVALYPCLAWMFGRAQHYLLRTP